MLKKINQTVEYINSKIDFKPEFGIILGTGLGGLVNEIKIEYSLNYEDIPNFPVSTVESHKGKMIFGNIGYKKVMALQGRFHFYEGYSFQDVTFPVRVMKMLCIKALIVSNACGSLNPDMKKGELMIITDHINFQGGNPLIGKNIDEMGPRFPDMSQAYHPDFIARASDIAKELPIKVHKGVYVSVQGPNLETKAEYKFLRIIGGDVVGMSTVPEILVARHMSLPCFAISVITDEGFHEVLEPVKLEDIINAASEAEPYMTTLIKKLVLSL